MAVLAGWLAVGVSLRIGREAALEATLAHGELIVAGRRGVRRWIVTRADLNNAGGKQQRMGGQGAGKLLHGVVF